MAKVARTTGPWMLTVLWLLSGGCVRSGYQETRPEDPPQPATTLSARWLGERSTRPFGDPDAATIDAGQNPPDVDAAADGSTPALDPVLGAWSITGFTDSLGDSYDICLTVTDVSQVGNRAGEVRYQNGLDCAGYVVLQNRSGSTYTFDELITEGANAEYCNLAGGGRIDTTLLAPTTLGWQWHRRTSTRVLADTSLSRVVSCP